MNKTTKRAWRVVGGGVGAAAIVGLGHVATTWLRYGRPSRKRDASPALIDTFLPSYEVRERHATRVAAPVDVTYAAAREMDLMQSPLVRAIFRGRELFMGASHTGRGDPLPIVDTALALGWGVLAQEHGREIVFGAVTQPWMADVRFRALPPDEFAGFDEPGYAKIAWSIRAEPTGPTTSRFITETRVATTDAEARNRFRRYWALVSPGIRLIRRESLRLVRSAAERRYRSSADAAIERGQG